MMPYQVIEEKYGTYTFEVKVTSDDLKVSYSVKLQFKSNDGSVLEKQFFTNQAKSRANAMDERVTNTSGFIAKKIFESLNNKSLPLNQTLIQASIDGIGQFGKLGLKFDHDNKSFLAEELKNFNFTKDHLNIKLIQSTNEQDDEDLSGLKNVSIQNWEMIGNYSLDEGANIQLNFTDPIHVS